MTDIMEMSRADRRAARRRQRAESPLLKMPFRQLHNPLPPLEILTPEQIEELHLASLHILENVGLDFLDDEALDLWQKAGAKVDRAAQHVWIDRGLLLETIASAPPTFTWRARNPDRDVVLGGNAITCATCCTLAAGSR
ncbi:MAG: trimethylamine methyltransferase family protein [Chloroflexi bacterium]|nr:trimethylamine methyltransferase family protein [Chloroflexota bacterium]